MQKPTLSVIIPTLDEGQNIRELFRRLLKLKGSNSFQFIVVDGGSVDNTRDEALQLSKTNKNIEFHGAPGGKGIALRLGFAKARANSIIFLDADLQYPPEEIPKVAKALKTADLVVTKRKTSELSHRRLLSLGFSQIIGKGLLSLPASDPQSGLKGVKKTLLSRLSLASRNWELDAELIKKAQAAGAKIKEVEIEFCPRIAGKTKTGIAGTSANLLAGSIRLLSEKSPEK